MDSVGLLRAARYAYPPNSLSLCGPLSRNNLGSYTAEGMTDAGLYELLGKFSTLYPYLCLIAGENHLKDPFDRRVVDAYWLGNALLRNVPPGSFLSHTNETLSLGRKNSVGQNERLAKKIVDGGLPHHAFHVLNIYVRTGHVAIPHTVETMDACIVNSGKIIKIKRDVAIVLTQPLQKIGGKLTFGKPIQRALKQEGFKDKHFSMLSVGDWVSYHWGYICEKISTLQRRNLSYHTNLAVYFSNLQMHNNI